jgi:hypothetical protein
MACAFFARIFTFVAFSSEFLGVVTNCAFLAEASFACQAMFTTAIRWNIIDFQSWKLQFCAFKFNIRGGNWIDSKKQY